METTQNRRVDPADLAPQGESAQDAADRRAIALTLIIEDDMPARRYEVDADHAWAHYNNPYDHMSSAYESPSDAATCWYEVAR